MCQSGHHGGRLPSLKCAIFMLIISGWGGWRWSREICTSCQSYQDNIFLQVSSLSSCFVNYCFTGLFEVLLTRASFVYLLVWCFPTLVVCLLNLIIFIQEKKCLFLLSKGKDLPVTIIVSSGMQKDSMKTLWSHNLTVIYHCDYADHTISTNGIFMMIYTTSSTMPETMLYQMR